MNALETRKAIQEMLHVAEDGEIGQKTLAALNVLCATPDDAPWPAVPQDGSSEVHSVTASSFADPADVRAFRECKANGGTDTFCFGRGDNGIGKWGDDCSAGSGLACALPPEYWQQFGSSARGKEVVITANGKTITAKLKDTMPHLANIHNGAGLDMNPDSVEALGLTPPIMVPATWAWA